MVGEVEYEGQKIQWKKRESLAPKQGKRGRDTKWQVTGKIRDHEILMEEYKQENKRNKLELKDQAQLINDISKECAKERKEKQTSYPLSRTARKY